MKMLCLDNLGKECTGMSRNHSGLINIKKIVKAKRMKKKMTIMMSRN